MPYGDGKRVAAFYESAFGWRVKALGREMNDYVPATTTETGQPIPRNWHAEEKAN